MFFLKQEYLHCHGDKEGTSVFFDLLLGQLRVKLIGCLSEVEIADLFL